MLDGAVWGNVDAMQGVLKDMGENQWARLLTPALLLRCAEAAEPATNPAVATKLRESRAALAALQVVVGAAKDEMLTLVTRTRKEVYTHIT
jgi:hypothetical protein